MLKLSLSLTRSTLKLPLIDIFIVASPPSKIHFFPFKHSSWKALPTGKMCTPYHYLLSSTPFNFPSTCGASGPTFSRCVNSYRTPSDGVYCISYRIPFQIDSSMGATFVGIIMAISGVGEALAAPIFGYWSNRYTVIPCSTLTLSLRIGRILPPVYTSIVMSGVGNALYLFLGSFSRSLAPFAIIISRFLSGAGSGMFPLSHQSISSQPLRQSWLLPCPCRMQLSRSRSSESSRFLWWRCPRWSDHWPCSPIGLQLHGCRWSGHRSPCSITVHCACSPGHQHQCSNVSFPTHFFVILSFPFPFLYSRIHCPLIHEYTFPIHQISDICRPTCVHFANLPIAVPSTSTTSSMTPSISPRSPTPSHPRTSFSQMTVKMYVTFPSFKSLKSSHIHIIPSSFRKTFLECPLFPFEWT